MTPWKRFVATMVASAGLATTIAPAAVLAHSGASAQIIVLADHVQPGVPFEVVAADLAPGSAVTFAIATESRDRVVALDTAVAPPDGHFTVTMSIPGDFPSGYARLQARAADGTQAETWVLVGDRTASTPAPPGAPPWWADPFLVVVLLIVLGAFVLVGYALIRRRTARRVAVASGRSPRRPLVRR